MQDIKSCSNAIILRFRLRQKALLLLHTTLKKPIAYAYVCAGFVLRAIGQKGKGLKLILKGRRVSNIAWANSVIGNIVHHGIEGDSELVGLLENTSGKPVEKYADWLLILKLPIMDGSEVLEKGAIIFKFSEMFAPMFLLLDTRLLARYFRIVLEPSSVGYSLPDILVWESLSPENVIVLSPYQDDFRFLSTTTSNLVPTKLGPADWVDTTRFMKIPDIEKVYDAIYVANFNPIKRVERFVQAVMRIGRERPDYRAAVVLAGHGSAKNEVLTVLECAKKYVSIDVYNSVDQVSLNELFNKSKVNILVSLREGSNKGLAEGLFSGTPALLIKENAGGNHLHINDMTGRIVPDSELEKTLIWFADHYDEFSPQVWAKNNICPSVSTGVLSEQLRKIELSQGRQWTKDLFAKANSPELGYLDAANSWLIPEREELLTVFSRDADEKNIISFVQQLQGAVIH